MTPHSISTNDQPNTTDGKVGYKHPPAKSQFRKGQSGNPRGRRKGQRNLAPVLLEVLRQTVTVKKAGKAQRMSKGEALIQILLSKAHNGDGRAIKAMLYLTEKIARIETSELKLGGHGNYEFMLIPGMATPEEWQREIDARHETAALRESIAAAARATGTTPTASQIAVLRESIVATSATGTSPTPTRRPVNRRNKVSVELDKPAEPPHGETASPPQTPALEPALPSVPTVARTGTYRKVNRRQPASPTTAPDA
jgi:hypothetical protein